MKYLFFFFVLFGSVASHAGEKPEYVPPWNILSRTTHSALPENRSVFIFVFLDENHMPVQHNIRYAFNGQAEKQAGNKSRLTVRPGSYRFSFFYNNRHLEVHTDSIRIKSREQVKLEITFNRSDVPVMAEKPVIYLYPDTITDVNVRLDLPQGFSFTYPAYDNGWQVTAHPNGNIMQGNHTYHYLFWEAPMPRLDQYAQAGTGRLVEQQNLPGFLDSCLSYMGFNGREKQDFITYWYPRMMSFHATRIRFLCNEAVDEYAPLAISPQPRHLFRVWMVWSPAGRETAPAGTLDPLPVLSRKGFTVLEWGGIQTGPPPFDGTTAE